MADERDDWSGHQPAAQQENEFIERHGMREYGLWHLGVDDKVDAGRYKYLDIEQAAHRLHSMIETVKA